MTGLAGALTAGYARSVSISQCSRGPTPLRAASRVRARQQPQALLIQRLFPFHRQLSTASEPRAPSPELRSLRERPVFPLDGIGLRSAAEDEDPVAERCGASRFQR